MDIIIISFIQNQSQPPSNKYSSHPIYNRSWWLLLLFARPLHSIIISSSTDIHSCIHSSYSSTVRYLASKGNNSGCTSTGSVRVHPTNHIQMEKKKKSPTTATHTASVKEALPTKGSSKSSSTLPAAAAAVVVDCDEAHTVALPVRVPPRHHPYHILILHRV